MLTRYKGWHFCCLSNYLEVSEVYLESGIMLDYNHTLSPETGQLVKEAALAAMSAWVAAIANNIKNPVAGIGAALDILSRDLNKLEEVPGVDLTSSRDTVERIKIRMLMLNEYVTELVDFAKPPTVVPSCVSLLEVVENIKRTIADLGVSSEIVTLNMAADSTMVTADVARLVLILKSLILNSVEAIGSAEKPVIRISTERQSNGKQLGVMISIEDNGPGFYENVVTHIFDPFFSTKEASTGLGLTLVKKYVDAHRGRIMISKSRDLRGARVDIFFPDYL